jgi:hypothetical protein
MKNKIGIVFAASIIAMAGIGVSYAGFTDSLSIAGTVSTGTVDWVVDSYSGTWVYKVPGVTNEIVVSHDPLYIPPQGGFLVASSYAAYGGADDTVTVTYNNIFPCTDFTADVDTHYAGTIPAKINIVTPVNGLGLLDAYTTITILINNVQIPQDQLMGVQLHQGDTVVVTMLIHLPQDDNLQGLTGSFAVTIGIIQWNEGP